MTKHPASTRLATPWAIETRAWWRGGLALLIVGGMAVVLGLLAGAGGWMHPSALWGADGDSQALERDIVWSMRWPRSAGAWLTGGLLGLAGALSQSVFRNPLADPYLLGSASGAALGVALALAVGASADAWLPMGLSSSLFAALGVPGMAFVGAWLAVSLTVVLAGGAARPMVVLVAGIAVGVVLGALREALTIFVPETLRAMQGFMLGSTSLMSAASLPWLAGALVVGLWMSLALSRSLDACSLGDDAATSLGVSVSRTQTMAIATMALATGVAVSQAGLVAFVGLAAPHVARRLGAVLHARQVVVSALAGAAMLAVADVVARCVMPPLEWPVGLITALVGGVYLLLVMRRSS